MIVERRMFFAWNLEKEKAYLEQKAKEGLRLIKVRMGAYFFVKDEPKDVVFQFDFQMLSKKDQPEYLELYKEWDLVCNYGGWYYFRKEGVTDASIFSNVDGSRQLFRRLLGFLLLIGFPLYYQTIVMFPNLEREGGLSTFYQFFRYVVYIFLVLHLFAVIRIAYVYHQLQKDIRE